ncbi:AlpA family phage regulatory protein [Herbaspirillum sp. HC18]|nr:AlpA family phage regulatory protein [Herbaspirillum sp. HC18]
MAEGIKEIFVKRRTIACSPQLFPATQVDECNGVKNACTQSTAIPAPYLALIEAARKRTDRRVFSCGRTAEYAGVGVSTLWRDVKNGTFVPPIKISPRRVAWVEAEIDAVLAAKALMTRTGLEIDIRAFIALLISPPADAA